MTWLKENSDVIGALASVGMLVVWLLYLQVFLILYRRQVKPTVLIEIGEGAGLDRRCLVINMSGEAIAIQSLICSLHSEETTITRSVTNVEIDGDEPSLGSDGNRPAENPISPGGMLDVGSYGELLKRLRIEAGTAPRSLPDEAQLEVQVVAAYGSDDLPVSALRCFQVRVGGGKGAVRPLTVDTRQIRSVLQRRRLRRLSKVDETFSRR